MFIFWGKKVVFRKLGYVADFCPICRGPTAFLLRRVGVVGHVYYLSFGEGRLAGHQRRCEECKTSFDAKPENYASIASELSSLPQLTAATFPNLAQVYAARMELEERIRNSPSSLAPAERQAAIRNPIVLMSPKVEQRFAATHIDKETGLSMLAVLLTLIAGSAVMQRVAPDANSEFTLAILGAGVAFVVWQGVGSGRRFMRREVIPQLAQTLRPLKPAPAELETVLKELKSAGHKIGARLKAPDLLAALD